MSGGGRGQDDRLSEKVHKDVLILTWDYLSSIAPQSANRYLNMFIRMAEGWRARAPQSGGKHCARVFGKRRVSSGSFCCRLGRLGAAHFSRFA